MNREESIVKAVSLHHSRRYQEACRIYRGLIEKDGRDHEAYHLMGLALGEAGFTEMAIGFTENAIEIKDDLPEYHYNTAVFYLQLGDLELCEVFLRSCIRIDSRFGLAYESLVNLRPIEPGNPVIVRMLNAVKRGKLSNDHCKALHFALGKAFEDVQEYNRSWFHYEKGNKLHNAHYDVKANKQSIDRQIASFTKPKDKCSGVDKPIFIIGMPRSGSTLIETVLGNHEGVEPLGEVQWIRAISNMIDESFEECQSYPEGVGNLNEESLDKLRQAYLISVDPKNQYSRVLDKNPVNFKHIGLIISLFPNARIIDSVRNPMDVGLSCYQQNFTAGQDFSFNLNHIADYYNGYLRMMSHWEKLYPENIKKVVYEEFIDDIEESTKDLAGFIDIKYDRKAILFHNSSRTVRTASAVQVRKPVYKTSLNRWKNYHRELYSYSRKIQFDSVLN